MDKEKQSQEQAQKPVSQYKGLPNILHSVRWTQHLLAIIAEVLILASFALSGMDVSLSGVMTGIVWLKWTWGAAFALGIDTSFVIAWVRVRQCLTARRWGAFTWNVLLALGMSFIVFQPVAIQLLQQSLNVSFNQALSSLGVNIVILVYARALVAVILGAVLALTNVESAMESEQIDTAQKPKRRLIIFDNMLNKIAPVISESEHPAQIEHPIEHPAQIVITQEPVLKQIGDKRLHVVSTELTPLERVKLALKNNPECSNRELGRLTNLAPATAKKHRALIEQERSQVM